MADANGASDARAEEIAALKRQMEEMRCRLEELTSELPAGQSDEPAGVCATQDSNDPMAGMGEPAYQQPHEQPERQAPGGFGEMYSGSDAYAYGYHVQPPYVPDAYGSSNVRAKDHVAAGLLGIFLGMFGIHKFYLGYNAPGFIMLGITILGGLVTFGLAASVMWLIGFIEGVIYLVKSQQDFERAYVCGKKCWF